MSATKVTSDPASKNPVEEPTGVVTSDSLAGESLSSGGSFAAGNTHAGAMGQSSKGTNTNNTDTSGATKLAPSHDKASRDAGEGQGVLNEGMGEGKDAGRGPTYATSGSGSGSSRQSGEKGVYHADQPAGGASSGTSSGNAGTAPSYTQSNAPDGTFKPKGKNLQEGGFDSDNAKNASFNQDIGGEEDPGRVAENTMIGRGLEHGADATSGKVQGGVSNDGQFDVLKEESA